MWQAHLQRRKARIMCKRLKMCARHPHRLLAPWRHLGCLRRQHSHPPQHLPRHRKALQPSLCRWRRRHLQQCERKAMQNQQRAPWPLNPAPLQQPQQPAQLGWRGFAGRGLLGTAILQPLQHHLPLRQYPLCPQRRACRRAPIRRLLKVPRWTMVPPQPLQTSVLRETLPLGLFRPLPQQWAQELARGLLLTLGQQQQLTPYPRPMPKYLCQLLQVPPSSLLRQASQRMTSQQRPHVSTFPDQASSSAAARLRRPCKPTTARRRQPALPCMLHLSLIHI